MRFKYYTDEMLERLFTNKEKISHKEMETNHNTEYTKSHPNYPKCPKCGIACDMDECDSTCTKWHCQNMLCENYVSGYISVDYKFGVDLFTHFKKHKQKYLENLKKGKFIIEKEK